MASQKPIEDFSIKADSAAAVLQKCIGVDFGTELTKIVHPTTKSDTGEDGLTLQLVTFESKHFEAVLNYLSQQLVELNKDDNSDGNESQWKLCVTGIGAGVRSDALKQGLGIDLEFADECSSDCAGFAFLTRHCNPSDICHPMPYIDPEEFAGMDLGEMFKKFSEAQLDLMGSGDAGDEKREFPCLLTVFGSTCRVFLVQEDGSSECLHSHYFAGRSFLGLSQIMAGAADYSTAMSMAASGKRGNVDLQVRELLAGTPDSPYGRLPPSLPVFPFGKAVDHDLTYEEARTEDLVHSLVATFVSNLIYFVTQLAGFNGVSRLRFAGGFFRHNSPRLELMKTGKLFTSIDSMDVKFFKIGHTAALGAMLI